MIGFSASVVIRKVNWTHQSKCPPPLGRSCMPPFLHLHILAISFYCFHLQIRGMDNNMWSNEARPRKSYLLGWQKQPDHYRQRFKISFCKAHCLALGIFKQHARLRCVCRQQQDFGPRGLSHMLGWWQVSWVNALFEKRNSLHFACFFWLWWISVFLPGLDEFQCFQRTNKAHFCRHVPQRATRVHWMFEGKLAAGVWILLTVPKFLSSSRMWIGKTSRAVEATLVQSVQMVGQLAGDLGNTARSTRQKVKCSYFSICFAVGFAQTYLWQKRKCYEASISKVWSNICRACAHLRCRSDLQSSIQNLIRTRKMQLWLFSQYCWSQTNWRAHQKEHQILFPWMRCASATHHMLKSSQVTLIFMVSPIGQNSMNSNKRSVASRCNGSRFLQEGITRAVSL